MFDVFYEEIISSLRDTIFISNDEPKKFCVYENCLIKNSYTRIKFLIDLNFVILSINYEKKPVFFDSAKLVRLEVLDVVDENIRLSLKTIIAESEKNTYKIEKNRKGWVCETFGINEPLLRNLDKQINQHKLLPIILLYSK